MKGIYWTISDILLMVKRNLMLYRRIPQLLIFSTIQPVMFVLLFGYVFGGDINVPTENYISYLLPGIIVQVVLFGAIQTGIGLNADLAKGMIDLYFRGRKLFPDGVNGHIKKNP